MSQFAILCSVASSLSLAAGTNWLLAYLMAPTSATLTPVEMEWHRVRCAKSSLFRYASNAIARIGTLVERWMGAKPVYEVWIQDGRVVPMSKHLIAGHFFLRSFFRAAAVATVVCWTLGISSVWTILLVTFGWAIFSTRHRVRAAESAFADRLQQIRADLSFAIDVIALFDSDALQLPVRQALKAVAAEFSGTELGNEMAIVDLQLENNVSMEDALRSMLHRWGGDEQVERFVELVIAKDDGDAAAESLRNLAREITGDRRRALTEKSETAQRKLSLANILFTYACILVLVAPFVMKVPEMLEAFR